MCNKPCLQPIPKIISACKTETLYPLSNNSTFFPSPLSLVTNKLLLVSMNIDYIRYLI